MKHCRECKKSKFIPNKSIYNGVFGHFICLRTNKIIPNNSCELFEQGKEVLNDKVPLPGGITFW